MTLVVSQNRAHNGGMPISRLTGLLLALAALAPAIDLKNAIVVAPANLTATEKKAAAMLVDEVEKRTRIRLPVKDRPYNEPSILLREASGLGAEGYRVQVAAGGVTVSGQRPARRAVRGGRAAAQSADGSRHARSARRSESRERAEVRPARPSARLPAEDQFLRRLGRAPVGAVHPRPGRLRHQRHRADSAALGRRRRQPALSAAADADDDRDVAAGERLRPRRVDLVSGDGPRLLPTRRRWNSR